MTKPMRFVSVILVVCMLCSVSMWNSKAEENEQITSSDGNYIYTKIAYGVRINQYLGNESNLVIPSEQVCEDFKNDKIVG